MAVSNSIFRLDRKSFSERPSAILARTRTQKSQGQSGLLVHFDAAVGAPKRTTSPVRPWTNSMEPSSCFRRCHILGSATGVTRGKTLCAVSHAFASSFVIESSPPASLPSTIFSAAAIRSQWNEVCEPTVLPESATTGAPARLRVCPACERSQGLHSVFL
jgi:hypothetical protein